MAKALQRRRGTTEEHKSFTGLEGEFTYDTTEKRIVAHDGVTKGGIPMAKKAELDSANSDLATTKTELQKAIDDAVAELEANISELGKHNVGEEWVSYLGKIPEGGVPYCGQEVTRSTYSALWQYAQNQGLVKSESEWQSIYAAQGGNVPFYSSGDGSTTFRMPSIKGYVKGASSQSESGSYVAEGLPNITGMTRNIYRAGGTTTGAFYDSKNTGGGAVSGSGGNWMAFGFDASRSNSIYGNSNHVTPETSVVMFGVYAFGEITNQGALDAETLATGLATVEANLEAKLEKTTVHTVDSWSNGTQWYRKYSDGWIEQGGYADGITSLSFPLAFSNKKYVFTALPDVIDSGNAVWAVRVYDGEKTTTGITSLITAGSNAGWTGTQNFKGTWRACGY